MAKKFGDDRSRDKELDTEIDMEEMDDLSMEDPWGDGSGMNDAGGGRSPSTPTRKMVVEGVKGLAEGAMASVSEEVERNMPNLYTVKSEISETFDDLKELKDEVAKQLQPMMLSMENATRKILPRAEKFMPKKLYKKIKGTLDARAEARAGMAGRSKEEERQDLISSELAGVFGSVTTELEKHKELEHHKERLMDKAVSSIQHRDLKHGLTRIYDSLRSTELFHRTLHTAYMKKSLELQYKHLFVAQDTHNLLARTFVAYEDYFKGIVKNTALPDVMKTQASDYIKKSRTEKYGTMMADFMTKARKMIFQKVKQSASDFLGNVSMIAQLGEMGADQLEALDDPMMAEAMGLPAGLKGLIVKKIAGWIGHSAASGPVRTALQKIAPFATALNGDMENFKRRAYMNLAKLGNKWRSETDSWWKPLLGDYIPNISAATTASNDLLAKSDDAAAFDKLTRQSIVEIIPGYLGKIWHEIALLRNSDAEEQTFNMYSRGFTSVSQYQRDILNDKEMFGTEDSQTEAVRDAVMVINASNSRKNPGSEKFSDDLKPTLSRIITNHAVKVQFFNPQEIAEFVLAPSSKRTVYIEDISQGCDPELFYKTCKAIVDGLKGKDGKLDQRYVKKFEDAILNVFDSTDMFKTRLATVLESWGSRRYLDGILVDKKNAINLDIVGRELSRFKMDGTEESAWKRKNLDEWIDAKDKVAAKVAEAKKRYHNSAIGKKLDAWRAEYNEWRAGNKEELPSIEGLTGTESGEGGTKPTTAPTGPDGKPLTPEEQKKLVEERFKSGAKKKVGGWLSFLWSKAKKTLDNQLNKLPKNEEDVERQVEEIQTSLSAIYDSRPKSAEEAKQKVTAWVSKLENDHPELAKRARQLLADANDSRIVIAIKAYGSYGKKKIGEQAEKITKTHWWQFGRKKVEAGKKEITEGWTKFFNWAKKYSDEHLQEIGLDRETLAKAFHGDKEALAKVRAASKKIYKDIKKAAPKVIKEKVEEAKQTLETKLSEAKTATVNAATSAARKLGEAHKATVEMGTKLASEYRSGAGITEPPKSEEAPAAPSVAPENASSDLMDLLTAWSQSHETNLRTIGEIVSNIDETLKGGLNVKGAKVGGGNGAISRVRNGFFGRGGRVIGGAVKSVAKVGLTIGKGIGKMYAGMGHLALGGAKAVVNTGRWLGNTAGLNPYVDVYVAGQEEKKPVLTWRKQAFGKGVVYADNNERVKQTKDIIKRGVPIIDPENGNVLIDEEMLRAGLWTKSGLWAGLGRAAVVGVKGFFGVEKQVVGGMFSIGKTIAEGLFGVGGGKEEPYVDVYRKGEIDGKPLLTRRQQKKGVFFANGERLEKSSDIHEPVYDADKQVLVSQEDIEHGLVDVNGKKLGRGQTSARQGLFGKAFDLGGTIAKGIFGETGLKIAGTAIGAIGHVYKGLFDALLGGGKAVGRGFANIGARLFGFDSPSGFGRKAFDGITSRLDTIIQIMRSMRGYGGGGRISGGTPSGGDGGSGGGTPDGGSGGPGGGTPSGGGGRSGGGTRGGGTPGGGPGDPFFSNKKSGRGRGRRGYWKNGKFIPDPKGDSFEKDGPEHPGGAAALLPNAAARVNLKASDNYVRKNWMDPDGDGVEGRPEDEDSGDFGLTELALWTLGEKALGKAWRVIRHPIKSAKAAYGAVKRGIGRGVNAIKRGAGAIKRGVGAGARILRAGRQAYKHGAGIKGAIKASATSYKRMRTAAKSAKAAKKAADAARAARMTKLAARGSRAAKTVKAATKLGRAATFFSKIPVIGKFARPIAIAAKLAAPAAAGAAAASAVSGAGSGFAAGAETATRGASTAARGGSSFTRFGVRGTSEGAAAGAKAVEATAKGASAAAKGTEAIAKGTEVAAKGASAAAKGTEVAAKGAGWASKAAGGLGKAANVAGKAAAPLEFIFAGGAANDARKNADQFLGRTATEAEKDTLAGQAAMDTLGLGIGNWLNEKIYGDANAAAKAALELDKELGIDKYSISTNTSEIWGDANKWWNPGALATDAIDGVTNLADATWKGGYRTVVGGAKAIYDNWGADEKRERENREANQKEAERKKISGSWIEAMNNNVFDKLDGIQLPGNRNVADYTNTGGIVIANYLAANKKTDDDWDELIGWADLSPSERNNAPPWWEVPRAVTEIVNFCKKYYPPTEDHPKERFEFFKKLYNGNRNDIESSVLEMFGIKQSGDVAGWDAAYKALEAAAKGGSVPEEEPKKGETSTGESPATPSAPVKEKVGSAAPAAASVKYKASTGTVFGNELEEFVNANGGLAALAAMNQVDRGKLMTKFMTDKYPRSTTSRIVHRQRLNVNLLKALASYKPEEPSAVAETPANTAATTPAPATPASPSAPVKEKVGSAVPAAATTTPATPAAPATPSTPVKEKVGSAVPAAASVKYKAKPGTIFGNELEEFVNANGGMAALSVMNQVERGKLITKFMKDKYPRATTQRNKHRGILNTNLNKALASYKPEEPSAVAETPANTAASTPAPATPAAPSTPVKEKVEPATSSTPVNEKVSKDPNRAKADKLTNNPAKDYAASIGGVETIKTMPYLEFQKGVVKWVKDNISRYAMTKSSTSKRMALNKAELLAKAEYARAFGITGKFSYQMGELIDPKTGKPVVLDNPDLASSADTSATTPATPATTPTDAGSGQGESMDSLVAPTQSADLGDTLKSSPGFKPPLDPTILGPMNKTNVVQPAEISLPNLEMAKQQGTSTETANVFEQYRKEQQEAAARQQKSLDQMNEMLTAMNPFFKQFGSVIDEKNGLRVAGIPELTAITAAKPAGGNTQIINNTIVQDQNDGLDLRKKQN